MTNKCQVITKNSQIQRRLNILILTPVLLAFISLLIFSIFNYYRFTQRTIDDNMEATWKIFTRVFNDEISNLNRMNRIMVKDKGFIDSLKKNDIYGTMGKMSDLLSDLALKEKNVKVVLFDKNWKKIAGIPGEFKIKPPESKNENILIGQKYEVIDNRLYNISFNPVFDDDGTVIANQILILPIDRSFFSYMKNRFKGELILQVGSKTVFSTIDKDISLLSENQYKVFDFEGLDTARIYVVYQIDYLDSWVRNYRIAIVLVFAVIFIISLVISSLGSKQFTRPIMNLVQSSRTIADGDLQKDISISDKSEIGLLACTMNEMRQSLLDNINELNKTNLQLDKKVYELSLLNILNQELNYLQDYKQVFRVILKHLTHACDSQRASVMIIENDELIVVEANKENEFIQTRPTVQNLIKNSAAGTSLKKGKSVIVRKAKKSRLFTKQKNNSYVDNILCIPFNVRENIKGVFNVVNRKRPWNKESAQIAQLIINQGLIAIDNARLYELAITDGLTGLYIHRYFQVRLSEEVAKSKRFEKKVSLAMLDIDHFKKFNDTYGHQTGDKVLRIVSDIVKENIRAEIDIAARYGGEEFAIIMPDTDSEGAKVTAERLRRSMEEYDFKVEGKNVPITISIGVSTFPKNATRPVDLILAADNALYRSKENGRNCVTAAEKAVNREQ